MPIYLFKDEDGNDVEQYYHMADAPRIGRRRKINGVMCTRVVSCHLSNGIARVTHQYPYVSKSLCRNIDGCKTNNMGQPIIRSQQHERNIAAVHDMEKE